MNRREERILHRAEKAGLKLAKKEGRLPVRDELLNLRIQILPAAFRWLLFLISVACGIAAWIVGSIGLGLASLLFLFFAIFGVRRTLETVADHASYDVIEVVLGYVGETIGSALD